MPEPSINTASAGAQLPERRPIPLNAMPQIPSPRQRARRRWLQLLYWVGALVLATLLLAGLASFMAQSGVDVHAVHKTVVMLKPYGIAIQAIAIVLIGWKWRAIVLLGRRKGIVKGHEFDQVLALRNKVLVFLLAYLLLIPIGPGGLARVFGAAP